MNERKWELTGEQKIYELNKVIHLCKTLDSIIQRPEFKHGLCKLRIHSIDVETLRKANLIKYPNGYLSYGGFIFDTV